MTALQRKDPVGIVQGMLRIVRGEQDGVAARSQRPDLRQHALLIAKVQIGRRLVHDENFRILYKCTGNERQLPLAAGNGADAPLRKRLDAKPLQGLHGCLLLPPAGALQDIHRAGRAHEHSVEHGIVEDRLRRLRDIGDLLRGLPPGIGGKRSAGESDLPRLRCQKAQQAAKQRAFPSAVCTEHRRERALLHGKAHFPQSGLLSVGKRQVLDLNFHAAHLPSGSDRGRSAHRRRPSECRAEFLRPWRAARYRPR